jgi:coenzyme F420-0:L-glutamate ligase/coenzyme F420-1:gamma-L-glutamate ligase
MHGLSQFPLVKKGDNIGRMICDHLKSAHYIPKDGDILVVAQKVVSIAEGAVKSLKTVKPSPAALELSKQTGRDPRLCQVILDESRSIKEIQGKVIVTIHKLGFRCTSAGVDKSNVGPAEGEWVSLLPKDPDGSAKKIREAIQKTFGAKVGVIINDSFGEPSREGSRGVGIGIAGIKALREEKTKDIYGLPKNSFINRVDEIASAASTIMGQTNGVPIVIGRGFEYEVDEHANIQTLLVHEKHV